MIKMNTITLVSFLALCFYSAYAYLDPKKYGEKLSKEGNEWHDICTDVTGATDEMIRQVRDGNFIEEEKMKRYILCLWRVSRIMDRNMKVDHVVLKEVLPEVRHGSFPQETRDCLVNSRNLDLKENYDKIYEFEKCMYKLNPEEFIMF
ncbi:pheromone-binding protein-related protein 6 [Leptinotarsa decemlineata]|uniref:pheromone-binding protein-related protein 6 n=1 Tax=Leptinotarsa decemlineata TaxID=7539 RepID=UPI003D30B492